MPPMGGPHGPGRRGVKPSIDNPGQVFKRLMKYIFKDYGAMFVIVFVMIIISVLASVQGTMFTKNLIDDYMC